MKTWRSAAYATAIGSAGTIGAMSLGKVGGALFWLMAFGGLILTFGTIALIFKKANHLGHQVIGGNASPRRWALRVAVFLVLISVFGASVAGYHALRPHGRLELQITDLQGNPLQGVDINVFALRSRNSVGFGRITPGNGT